jgi:3-methylcrotonyl-CoA carboxylase alpha subunit
MAAALAETGVAGLRTNQEFLSHIFRQKDFLQGDVDTGFIAAHEKDLLPAAYGRPTARELALAGVYFMTHHEDQRTDYGAVANDIWEVADNWRLNGVLSKALRLVCRGEAHDINVTVQGLRFTVQTAGETVTLENPYMGPIFAQGHDLTLFADGRSLNLHLFVPGADDEDAQGEGRIAAPMPGKIVNVMVKKGDMVEKDQPLLVMEAMKMEMTIRAGCGGVVDELPVAVNDQVADGALLVSIKAEDVA